MAVSATGSFRDAHPREVWLIIEVAGSSLRKDSGVKAHLSPECGVAEYWVVDLAARVVEVHSDIVQGRYTQSVRRSRTDRVTLARIPT